MDIICSNFEAVSSREVGALSSSLKSWWIEAVEEVRMLVEKYPTLQSRHKWDDDLLFEAGQGHCPDRV